MKNKEDISPRPDYKAKIRKDLYHFGKTGHTKRLTFRQYNLNGILDLNVMNGCDDTTIEEASKRYAHTPRILGSHINNLN